MALRYEDGQHWYAKDGTTDHDAGLREARKKLLYPSVTSIDKEVFPNPFLSRWKTQQLVNAAAENPKQPNENSEQYAQRIYEISMEKATVAAQFGKEIHKTCEKWPENPPAKLLPWFDKFDNFMRSSGVVPINREMVVLNHALGIAGTFDMEAEGSGFLAGRWIIDLKTQDVKISDKGKKTPAYYESWPRQLGFYWFTRSNQPDFPLGALESPRCLSLVIDSNEGGEVYSKVWDPQEITDAYQDFIAGAWLFFRKRDYWPAGRWHMGRI